MLNRITLFALASILTVFCSPDAYSLLYTDHETKTDPDIYLEPVKYYDPHAGRFISRDPLADGINWYIYARNNPLAFIDPTGLASRAPNETEMARLTAAATFTFGRDNAAWLISSLREFVLTDDVLLDDTAVRGYYFHPTRTLKIRIDDLAQTYFDPASDMRRLGTFIHELTHTMQHLKGIPNPKDNLPDKDNIYSHTAEQLVSLTFGHEPMARATSDWFKVMYRDHLGLWPQKTAVNFKYYAGAAFEWYGITGESTPQELVYIAGYYYYALVNMLRTKPTTWGAIKK